MSSAMWKMSSRYGVVFVDDREIARELLSDEANDPREREMAVYFRGGKRVGWQFRFPLATWDRISAMTGLPFAARTETLGAGEGRRTEDGGRTTEDGGRTTKDEGRRTKDGGRTTKDGGSGPRREARGAGRGERTKGGGVQTVAPPVNSTARRGRRTPSPLAGMAGEGSSKPKAKVSKAPECRARHSTPQSPAPKSTASKEKRVKTTTTPTSPAKAATNADKSVKPVNPGAAPTKPARKEVLASSAALQSTPKKPAAQKKTASGAGASKPIPTEALTFVNSPGRSKRRQPVETIAPVREAAAVARRPGRKPKPTPAPIEMTTSPPPRAEPSKARPAAPARRRRRQ
ncbi:MAG TPA: hypothetical protein VFJ58_02285 [Armatimonadota bacterium]|nr:hypothetical protein [Armatimonadota bacterium]